VQTREWLLTAAVIIVPLIIAVVVTMWSLDQVRYRPKQRRSVGVARETSSNPEPHTSAMIGSRQGQEQGESDAGGFGPDGKMRAISGTDGRTPGEVSSGGG
jgi:hypothetical protein